MKTLRGKLFVSVGILFLIVAILSYSVPKIFIRKDIDKAGAYMTASLQKYQTKLEKTIKDWISYRLAQAASDPTSISDLVQQFAALLETPILIIQNGMIYQGFSQTGEPIPIHALSQKEGKILLNNEVYIPSTLSVGDLKIAILTPEAQKQAISNYMVKLRDSLVDKISLNLLSLAVILFIVALLFLARISKRITKPIVKLALAAEEIGEGKYEQLDLPPVETRHDEVTILTHAFEKMVISLRDREKMRGVLNKVVSKEIASEILESKIELGGEERFMTILFSDIRGFTALSERLEPKQLISLLNEYMTRMCRIIDLTKGVVDKFVGDEIMALYGAPLDLEDHVEKAIQAAVEMMQDLANWNKERENKGEEIIEVGIGVHTGRVFSGNMGAENRLNYTVVGANVNLASRLCSEAKPMQILISQVTHDALKDSEHYKFNKLPPLALKGVHEPITTFEIETAANEP